jgi:anti-sigma factor RsiW
MCEDKELLVGYLYDDLADGDRARFEAHLRACGACRTEVKAMRAVRADLAAWAPPEPDFGFRVIRGGRDAAERDVIRPVVAPPVSWRAWWTPAAGFAAAAVLVLAAAASLAHVEVHRGPDGVTVRTGWSTAAPTTSAANGGSAGETRPNIQGSMVPAGTPASPAPRRGQVDPEFVAAIARRLDALEAASSHDSGVHNASTMSARAADAEIIKRVRELLAQSENRQQGELALRIAQLIRDVDAQRVADLARIQQGLGRIDATVTAEAARHSDLTNFILTNAKQR